MMSKDRFFPYLLEISTKVFGLSTSIMLISFLTTEQFGEYSFVRSFVLITSTLLLFGLQASSFRFANHCNHIRLDYLHFSLFFITVLGIASGISILLIDSFIFSNFNIAIGEWIKYLIILNMLSLFFVAYAKASGKPITGYTLTFATTSFFFLLVATSLFFNNVTLGNVLNQLLIANALSALFTIIYFIKKLSSQIFSFRSWAIQEWLSVSFSMWLAGFLPLFLLQGLVLFFGFYFETSKLGEIGIAVLVVANLAMFKEISISLFLPLLMVEYTRKKIINKELMTKCVLWGTIPTILFLICCFIGQRIFLPEGTLKLSKDFFTFLYILGFGQVLMAVYQPIFRVLASVGLHTLVFKYSLILSILLFCMYITAGLLHNSTLMAFSSVIVSLFALILSMFFLIKEFTKEL